MKPAILEILLIAPFFLASAIFCQSVTLVRSKAHPSELPTISSRIPQTTTIDVGKGDFKFSPDSVQAEVGDVIQFRFFPTNHSVARAEYLYPCIPYESVVPGRTGFFSGFQPMAAISDNPPSFYLRINDTDPVFFYCAAPNSCNVNSMVGVINPNSSTSLSTQKDMAKQSPYALAPGEPFPDENVSLPATQSVHAGPNSPSRPSSAHANGSAYNSRFRPLSAGTLAGVLVGGILAFVVLAALLFSIRRAWILQEELKRHHARLTTEPATAFAPSDLDRSGPIETGADIASRRTSSPPIDHVRCRMGSTSPLCNSHCAAVLPVAPRTVTTRADEGPHEMFAP